MNTIRLICVLLLCALWSASCQKQADIEPAKKNPITPAMENQAWSEMLTASNVVNPNSMVAITADNASVIVDTLEATFYEFSYPSTLTTIERFTIRWFSDDAIYSAEINATELFPEHLRDLGNDGYSQTLYSAMRTFPAGITALCLPGSTEPVFIWFRASYQETAQLVYSRVMKNPPEHIRSRWDPTAP